MPGHPYTPEEYAAEARRAVDEGASMIHIRARDPADRGAEDNFHLPDGRMARSNGELAARARRLAEDVGRRVAGVGEARERLGLAPATVR